MQRVTNCILHIDDKILMLKKPRRGWYVAPGGKMEPGESIKDSAVREFKEETGLSIQNPKMKGSFTFIIRDGEETVQEWMMFTFYCRDYKGALLEESEEGELEWVHIDDVLGKPMAEGDRHIFNHILTSDEQIYGTFVYTPDYQLLDIDLDPTDPE